MADQQSIPPLRDDSGRRAVMVPVMHHPGRHCASTGICNLMNFHGIKWSEALCFGIGAGLGIWYLDLAGPSPSRLVHVRSADIEQQFFRQIGCASDWEEFDDPEEAEQALCTRLGQGRPAIIRTDIFHLPYYGSSTHFPGHVITVWGYHEAKRVFFLTDTEREELLEVGFADLSRARFSSGGLFDMKGNMLAPGTLPVPDDMPDVIRRAVVHNSRILLDDAHEFQGLAGLKRWQSDILNWGALPDWRWVARFAYQVIERRGTGGGGFRLMYADFLEEARHYVPLIGSMGLDEQMRELGLAWQDLAMTLKEASEGTTADFRAVSEKLRVVCGREAAYHADALCLG